MSDPEIDAIAKRIVDDRLAKDKGTRKGSSAERERAVMSEDGCLPVAPVRLCCGQRHDGVQCPDGLVMCCVCFSRVPVAGLKEVPGGHTDVCLDCA